MKANDRKDMKKNDLADTLERIRVFFDVHGSKILAVAILVLVVVPAVAYFIHSSAVARAQAWEQLLSIKAGRGGAARPDDLRNLALQTSDRKVAAFAWKELGDTLSLESLITDQAAKRKDMTQQAEDAYRTVLEKYADFPIPAAGAKMGLAALYENSAKWDQAKQIYQQIEADNAIAGTGIQNLAKNRLQNLTALQQSASIPLATTQPAATKAPTTTQPSTAGKNKK